MVDGLQNENSLVESQFVRYVLYRDSDRDTVIRKMQHLLKRDPHLPWFSALEKKFFPDSKPYPVKLKSYFDMISGGKLVKDAIKKLGPVNGFNNNAFMLKLLYNKATEGQRSNEEFVNYMLTTLRNPKWSNNKFLSSLRKLVENDVPYDLRTKLLEPMLTTALKQVKASRSDHA